jgi:hypothetical protein
MKLLGERCIPWTTIQTDPVLGLISTTRGETSAQSPSAGIKKTKAAARRLKNLKWARLWEMISTTTLFDMYLYI